MNTSDLHLKTRFGDLSDTINRVIDALHLDLSIYGYSAGIGTC